VSSESAAASGASGDATAPASLHRLDAMCGGWGLTCRVTNAAAKLRTEEA